MQDAHLNTEQDREITREGFQYAIFEAKVRLFLAASIILIAALFIPLSAYLFDPPESIAVIAALGLASASPIIGTLLRAGKKNDDKP